MRLWWLVLLVGCKATGSIADSSPPGLATSSSTSIEGCPPLEEGTQRGGDAARDAQAEGAWFRSVRVPGVTDVDLHTSGAAWVDLDGDGDLDALISHEDHQRFYSNEGCFQLVERSLNFVDPPEIDGGAGGAMAVDLNRDGLLDLYLPFHGSERASQLWMAQGSWNRFVEVGEAKGVGNFGNYGRAGPSVGDLNNDGWLDIATGGHQIGGSVELGRPMPGLFVFEPGPKGFEDGAFVNLANTAAAPGFGGADSEVCALGEERTGLQTRLRDLDDDGDLDLLWATHNDMFNARAGAACATGTNVYGLSIWLSDSAESVSLVEVAEADSALVDHGQMVYDEALNHYLVDAEGSALGPESMAFFDADNDGDRDLLAIGPTDPDWHVNSDLAQPGQPGRLASFFTNDNGTWTDSTAASGLAALEWTLGDWATFFDSPLATTSDLMSVVCLWGSQVPLCEGLPVADRQPYPSEVLPFDADNDGWTDLLYVMRQCHYDGTNDDRMRTVLFHNQGDGSFEPLVTEISGITGCALGAFAVDIDGDGWVDIHLAVRDFIQTDGPVTDFVFRNKGAELVHGDRHWLKIGLVDRPMGALLGARVTALAADDAVIAVGYYEVEAWRGSKTPTVHLGLADHTHVTIEVRLRDGTVERVSVDSVDGTLEIGL